MWPVRLFLTGRFPPAEDLPQAILLGLQHLEQLSPPAEQRIEFLRVRVGEHADLGTHALSEERQEIGINKIGLGELAGRLREVAHLARVDDHDRQCRAASPATHSNSYPPVASRTITAGLAR